MTATWSDLAPEWYELGVTWSGVFDPAPEWFPNPTVIIAGRDYTGNTVDSVSINRGRDTVYSSPAAGFGTINLIDVDGMVQPEVGDSAVVLIDDPVGAQVPLFTGFVSDWRADVISRGLSRPIVRYQLQVVGPLARLNRRQVLAAGSPSELDGARVLAVVEAGLPVPWGEFSTVLTWDDVVPTWETIDPGFDVSLIDDGVFTLTALAAADAGYSALQVVQDAGSSAKGLLFETADGFIGYADDDRRFANKQAGFLNVPFGVLDVNGLSVSSSLSDLTNRVIVQFGEGSQVLAQDDFSVGRFGLQETVLSTILAGEPDAQARANDLLFSNAAPSIELQSLTVNLRSDFSDVLRQSLIRIAANDAVSVSGAPVAVLPSGFQGFVEGVQWRVNDFEAVVTLLVSDQELSIGAVRYGQLSPSLQYGQVDPLLAYRDARSVEAV